MDLRERIVVGVIVLALALAATYVIVWEQQLGHSLWGTPEVEVQTTDRECLVGDFVAPAQTPYGDIALTPMFICGTDLLYESDPGDAIILNDYFNQWKGDLH